MRRIFALILAVVLLAGCAAGQPVHTNPAPMTDAEPVGGLGNLWYLPNDAVEAMEVWQFLGTEDGLLLWGSDELKLLDWEDLSISSELVLEAGDLSYVQIQSDGISITDPEAKMVTLFTDDLDPAGSIPSEAGGDFWLLSPDADTLYALSPEEIRIWDPDTGTDRELLRYRMMSVAAMSEERLWLSVVPETDLMTHWYELDLTDGTLTELTDSRMIALQEGLLPQSNGAYLHVAGQTVTQYGPDGGFVSICTIPDHIGMPGWEFVWSDRWQGWFFLAYGEQGCRMLFWDPAVETDGTDIEIQPETIPEGELLPRELYDRAEELSRRFDLDIRIAERAIRNYSSYISEVLTDPDLTSHALDVLETALSAYPEGFFSQLKYDDRHTVRIELVDALAAKSDKDVSTGASAFTGHKKRYTVIVLDAGRIRESAIFHEVSHIIDKCLDWDARLRADSLYSEEGWMALQPEGFEYAGSYKNVPDSIRKFYDSGYFVRDYSCVSASEDRAMMLEKAMVGEQSVFDANPHLMPKLEYYCACIRDAFDTSLWPEVTRWERLLPQN